MQKSDEPSSMVLSYMTLRKAIGVLGLALPWAVLLLAVFAGHGFQSSISGYYYTAGRDLFVGILLAIGVFLVCYEGYGIAPPDKRSHLKAPFEFLLEIPDHIVTKVAGGLAIVVAICPTDPPEPGELMQAPAGFVSARFLPSWTSAIHLGSAALFLLALALMALLFSIKDERKDNTSKDKRNKIYVGCALAIVLSVIACGVVKLMKLDGAWVYGFEASAVTAFGISWLVKGIARKEQASGH